MADLAYYGPNILELNRIYVPFKYSKTLTIEQLQFNKIFSKKRVLIEHVNSRLKSFKNVTENTWTSNYDDNCKIITILANITNIQLKISLNQKSLSIGRFF